MTQQIYQDRNARLNELDVQHYQLEDQIKDLNEQLRELGRQHAERMKVLIDERAAKARQLEKVNAEADQLRHEKRLS